MSKILVISLLHYVSETELEQQIEKTIEAMTIDKDFLKLALEEINKANEKGVISF